MSGKRTAGYVHLKKGGVILNVIGDVEYDIGGVKRSPIIGSEEINYGEEKKVAFLQCKVENSSALDLAELFATTEETVTCEQRNGKTVVFRDAWYAGEQTANTNSAEIDVRFEAEIGEEL